MDSILVLRIGYLSAALLVLLVALVPSLNRRFLAYGARSSDGTKSKTEDSSSSSSSQTDEPPWLAKPLDLLASITVPHSWFTSFYVTLVICCFFWGQQVLTHGHFFLAVADNTSHGQASMTPSQIKVVFAGLTIQGVRRVNESFAIAKPSASRMWIGHWVLGIGFYLATSMAVWIEGVPVLRTHNYGVNDLTFAGPSFRSFVSMLLFLVASGIQHDCHNYLTSIKPASTSSNRPANEYRVPTHPAFARLIVPHYFAECVIYLSLTIAAAPKGYWVNWTMACALVFVVVNLGVTAEGTKRWYESRFGRHAVQRKWRMLPFIF